MQFDDDDLVEFDDDRCDRCGNLLQVTGDWNPLRTCDCSRFQDRESTSDYLWRMRKGLLRELATHFQPNFKGKKKRDLVQLLLGEKEEHLKDAIECFA